MGFECTLSSEMSASARRWYGALLLSMVVHGFLLSRFSGFGSDIADSSRPVLPELEVNIDREGVARDSFSTKGRVDRAEGAILSPAGETLSVRGGELSKVEKSAHQPTPEPSPREQDQDQDQDLLGRSLMMARAQVVDPFAGKRVQALSAQTHDLVFGPYAEAWRQKVERVGALNYPAPVNGRELQGDVRLTVTLHQDGSIALLEVRQSSGIEALDVAAQHIVQMAAPFQPFTDAMREHADLITLTRTFHFIRAGEALEMR